jgi:hypothetical protein
MYELMSFSSSSLILQPCSGPHNCLLFFSAWRYIPQIYYSQNSEVIHRCNSKYLENTTFRKLDLFRIFR